MTLTYDDKLATIAKANFWSEGEAFDHCSAMDEEEFNEFYQQCSDQIVDAPAAPQEPRPTERQWSYLRSLSEQILQESTNGNHCNIARYVLTEDMNNHTRKQASTLIDAMKQNLAEAKAAARNRPEPDVPEGIHFRNDRVFKVQVAVHGSGKKYAKELNIDTGAWEYRGRAPLADLSADTIMTLEQAQQFGHLYGMCCRCGATLTDEGSIERGIGPVCASKF